MITPLLHPITKQQLDAAIMSSHHALLLTGPYGTGKGNVAQYIATQLLDTSSPNEYQLLVIEPDGNGIGIEAARNLQHFMKLTSTGTSAVRRVAIVENMQASSEEAQNALLKILEEPPAASHLIITATTSNRLLSTVRSRLYEVQILPLTKSEARKQYPKISEDEFERAYLLSDGYVELLGALLNKEQDHPLFASIKQAKEFVQGTSYHRLLITDTLAHKEYDLELFLYALKRVLRAGLPRASVAKQTNRLENGLKLILELEDNLVRNPNKKLALTNLALNL